jgi:hypothetical protein
MSLFGNLARIVTAPLDIVDKLIVEPIADVADIMAEEMGARDE